MISVCVHVLIVAIACDGNSCGELTQCFSHHLLVHITVHVNYEIWESIRLSTSLLLMYIVCIPWTLVFLNMIIQSKIETSTIQYST